MEQNIDNKTEIKDKLISLYKSHKFKFYLTIIIIVMAAIVLSFLKISNEKQNHLISEKYIQAGQLLSLDKKEKSKSIYEEIIISKNKFYSILALNNILENNLETDQNKILRYFKIVGELNIPQTQIDFIVLKKALYLIKNLRNEEGNKLLKNLIITNSKLKPLAEEIINK